MLGTSTHPIGVARTPLGVLLRTSGGKSRALRSGQCLVGSDPANDLVIDEKTVSRRHLKIELCPEGVRITDMGSRNGTFVGGQRIERATVNLGTQIHLGTASVFVDSDVDALESIAPLATSTYRGLVGGSLAMRRLYARLTRLEGSLVSVLVLGESGVGKELIARALHDGSRVADGPFVSLNCGALPRELVASELFGHKRGAFTGSVEARRGVFQRADRGTLFLDELGELPLDVQPALLRVLETGELSPVGSDEVTRVRVRVVAATNRTLPEDVKSGRFREDLFYRLAVVTLAVPPLRERLEDVESLADQIREKCGIPPLSREVVQALSSRVWPGNVRELRNAIQAYGALGELPAAAATTEKPLDSALADTITLDRPFAEQKEALYERFTRAYLQKLMAQTGGNQTAAAKISGLSRPYLGKLLFKLRLAARSATDGVDGGVDDGADDDEG
jgi:DNA-binding NtrC family response regulator